MLGIFSAENIQVVCAAPKSARNPVWKFEARRDAK